MRNKKLPYNTYLMSAKVHNTISQLRAQRKVTQEELAQAVGVTRQTIIAMEKGNYTPSVLLALKIAQFFKTSVESIFTITYENN